MEHPRLEDPRLLSGRGIFVDDQRFQNQAYMGLVRSTVAHAKIKRIDFSKIVSDPDYIASLTGDDLLKVGVAPITQNQWPPQKKAKRYQLAVGEVRFAGEPVAAVLSRSKYALEDLIENVAVDYEPLPVVETIEEAKKRRALVYEEWGDNVSQSDETKWGDFDEAIRSSAYKINSRESIARQVAAPIEPRAVLVKYDNEQDRFEVHATVQSAHNPRRLLMSELKMPLSKFHVQVMDVGGGFGSKGAQSYPEALLACLFAKRMGLPVKWVASRTEEFLEAAAGRDEHLDVTLACGKDGKLLALRGKLECDAGVGGTQNHMSMLTIWTMIGLYGLRAVDMKMGAYVTNKMPLGPVRGAGAPEGCYFIERAVDALASKAGIDPIEFRRRNLSKNSGGISNLLDALEESAGYQDLLKWRDEANSKSPETGLVAGIGISAHGGGGGGSWNQDNSSSEWGEKEEGENEDGAWEDSEEGEDEQEEGVAGFSTETAKVAIDQNGRVTVYTGSSPHGQGHETTFAQLASEELGVPIENVAIVWGDTDLIPLGTGTFGSRSAATGGSAVVDASRKLREKILSRASEVLKRQKESLLIESGYVRDGSGNSRSISEILRQLKLPEISEESSFTLNEMSHSSAVHLCALTLDLSSQKVSVPKYVIVEDAGRVINREIVEGQLEGGVVHALGGALYERLAYDSDGNLLTTTFLDYAIPAAEETPGSFEVHLEGNPSAAVLDGAKGIGESGTIAGYPAIANALNDAMRRASPGTEINELPVTQEAIFYATAAKVPPS